MIISYKSPGIKSSRQHDKDYDMQKQRGFTMTELMITLAILGIVVAMAMPAYSSYVLKANRTDAKLKLAQLATLQERYYFMNNSYTDDFADIVVGATTGQPVPSDEGHYSIALTLTGGGTGWTMVATAVGAQADDTTCASLTQTSLGAKTALTSAAVASPDCW